ncbi:hypothetical protein SOV_39740 [Sporomusa ovata DSM 2662]|uniref:Uncharacterized protein n=1 Tax=Sporomusa ovata TaxID=2378 RepID=A0A0U1KSQ1_9FIRM|nr:hypothetical protein [Sporomusa ovata]EQB26361.1 hypothetical protein SOV_3c02350 [Sporomusa ovata DSM 2662]CQR70441.1 hypothetical protein SpAn4DRAFT_1410 [Sporomusa ovata]
MQIKILDKVYECENQIAAVENVFSQVNELVTQAKLNLGSIVIDGTELYGDYDQYIVEHIEDIKTIIINVRTLKELMDDTLVTIQEYLLRAIPEIDKIVDEFYYEVTPNTWDKFAQLLEGLQFITDSLATISENQEWYYNASQFNLIKQNILRQIAMLQEAMELQDRVKLSDALLYEIIPSFQALNKEINVNSEYGKVQ